MNDVQQKRFNKLQKAEYKINWIIENITICGHIMTLSLINITLLLDDVLPASVLKH